MSTEEVRAIIEDLLAASGGRGITLVEARDRHELLGVTRPEEIRGALQDLVTEGRAEVRGQRAGFAVHVPFGAPHFTLIQGERPS